MIRLNLSRKIPFSRNEWGQGTTNSIGNHTRLVPNLLYVIAAHTRARLFSPLQQTTSRVGKHTRLMSVLLKVMTYDKHTNTHTHIHTPWEDQCEWHRMTRMTGPDCAVMCNLINTHKQTPKYH